MALCKFYQQGTCKFGTSCRFEHPGVANNRFGALAAGAGDGGLEDALSRYNISIEVIQKDLATEAPQWILSAYAPGRNAPEQLFGGYPREQSFEEMRLHFLTARASGNEQLALNQAQELYQNAQQQMQTALSNIQDAARFIVEAENKRPNRLDICREGTQGAPFGEFAVGRRPTSIAPPAQTAYPFCSMPVNTASPFGGAAAQSTPSAFGQPSVLGQRPNPFSAPAFGQAAQPSSAFGQPMAQPQATLSGQAPQPSASPFGQTAQTTSTFGQPSVLGAKPNPFGAPAFGQPAQPAATAGGSAFGQVAQLGGTTPSPFASAGGNAPSPFGAVAASSNATAPAANPFASASSAAPANAAANPFASNAPNQNGSITATSNPFGQNQTQNTNAFGQASGQSTKPNPFATTSTAEPQQSSNPFAQNTQNGTGLGGAFGSSSAASPFGQPQPQQPNPFAAAAQARQASAPAPAPSAAGAATPAANTNPYPPGSNKKHPAIESYATRAPDGTLSSFKGKPVTYKDNVPGIRAFNGTWTRIWFPAGAPAYYKDTELPSDQFDERSASQWAIFNQTGNFADGIMPELPPPRECTVWDF